MERNKYTDILDKNMNTGGGDALSRFERGLAEMQETMLLDFPLWARLNYISNSLSNLINKTGADESVINWDKVNEILTTNRNKYDFNDFSYIDSLCKLSDTRINCSAAQLGIGIWQRHTCKSCGKEFTLEFGEVDFYRNKGLNIPVRCKDCRDKSRQKEIAQILNDALEENKVETPMQIAMRKAGLI